MGDTTVKILDRGARVRIGGTQPHRVTLDRRTIAEIANNRPKTIVRPQPQPVGVISRNPTVRTGAGMGIQGRPGAPGSSIPSINFSWGDAPQVVWTPTFPGLLTLARIDITTPFNGSAPAITLGTLLDPAAAFPADQNDPTTIARYERNPDLRLTAGQGVVLTITPGALASAGAGLLILEFLPD